MSEEGAGAPATLRERAVSRTLDPARERAEQRVQAFLDAARDLLSSPEPGDVTLQMVVDRSGQSLRSFYQHFAGKYELLLAVFEDGVQATAEELAGEIRGVDDPLERLRTFVLGYARMCRRGAPRESARRLPGRAMAPFAHQLLIEHAEEAGRVFTPLVSLLDGLFDDAARAGAIRDDLDRDDAGTLLQIVMFNAFGPTIAGTADEDHERAAARLWDLLYEGLVSAR